MSNPTAGWSLQPGGLARRLRELREAASLTGSGLAEKLDWNQSKVSKIETGKQIPSEEDIRAYALAVQADEPALRDLLDLQVQATAINREWRQGHESVQRSYDELVRAGSVVRNLEVTTIPGLLQTREYARYQKMQAVRLALPGFAEDQIEHSLDGLAERQEALRDGSKRYEFAITEAALRLRYCPVDMMVAQLGHLLAFTYPRANLWFGIIPFGVELQLVPQNRFIAVDDEVLVEDFAAETRYRGSKADVYLRAWDIAVVEAVTGDEARRLIVAAMRALD